MTNQPMTRQRREELVAWCANGEKFNSAKRVALEALASDSLREEQVEEWRERFRQEHETSHLRMPHRGVCLGCEALSETEPQP